MTLEEVKNILENRLKNLEETRKVAVISGSLIQVASIDDDISSTKISLQQINVILSPL